MNAPLTWKDALRGALGHARRLRPDDDTLVVLRRLPKARLMTVDQRLRTAAYCVAYPHADGIKATAAVVDAQAFTRVAAEDRDACLFHALCHHNGYTRQAALTQAAKARDALSLAGILMRCADWVPAVAAAARVALDLRLRAGDGAQLFGMLDLLSRLGDAKRYVDSDAARWVAAELLAPRHREHRWQALRDGVPASVVVLDLIVRADADGVERACEIALRRADVPLAHAALALVTARGSSSADALIDLAVRSKLVSVRIHAWRSRIAAGRVTREDFLTLLDSPARALRDLARFHWRAIFGADVLEVWRERLDRGAKSHVSGAFLGLCEHGDARDAERLKPFLHADGARIRALAMKALDRLGALDDVFWRERPLASWSRSELRVVLGMAARRGIELADADILDWLARSDEAAWSILRPYLNAGSPWRALRLVLTQVDSHDKQVTAAQRAELRWQLARASTTPTLLSNEERTRLMGLIDRASERLGVVLARELRFATRMA